MAFDLSLIVLFAAVILGLFPIIHYLLLGYRERKLDILGGFGRGAIQAYLDRYYKNWSLKDGEPAHQLEDIYNRRFGRKTYYLPLIVYFVTLGLSVLVIVASAYETLASSMLSAFRVPDQVAYALAGAYLWVVSDLLSRYRRRDMVSWSLYDGSFRFLIAVPVAYSLTWLVDAAGETETVQAASNAVAFGLGTFPTSTLLTFLRRNVASRLNLSDDSNKGKNELETIEGINTSLAERFAEIGITTFHELAYEDPIQLTMRMNLPFRVVLDLMSQALLALYVENPLLTNSKSGEATTQASGTSDDEDGDATPDGQAAAGRPVPAVDASAGGQAQDDAQRGGQPNAAAEAPGQNDKGQEGKQPPPGPSTRAAADGSILPIYRKYQVRSALDAKGLYDSLQSRKKEQHDDAEAVLRGLAHDLKMEEPIVRYTLYQLAEDPATVFFDAMPI